MPRKKGPSTPDPGANDEEAYLAKLFDEEPESEVSAQADKGTEFVMGLLDNFLLTQKEVQAEYNENRVGVKAEIDHLHAVLMGAKPGISSSGKISQAELEALARLRQIQADQTAGRVSIMDSTSKLISACRSWLKGSNTPKSQGSLRDILADSGDVKPDPDKKS